MAYIYSFPTIRRVTIRISRVRFLNHIESYGFHGRFPLDMARTRLLNGLDLHLSSKKNRERRYDPQPNLRCFSRRPGFRLESQSRACGTGYERYGRARIHWMRSATSSCASGLSTGRATAGWTSVVCTSRRGHLMEVTIFRNGGEGSLHSIYQTGFILMCDTTPVRRSAYPMKTGVFSGSGSIRILMRTVMFAADTDRNGGLFGSLPPCARAPPTTCEVRQERYRHAGLSSNRTQTNQAHLEARFKF